MPAPKQPPKSRSTDEILREMEELANSVGSASDTPAGGKSGGALKSLMNFFIKIEPDGESAQPAAPPANPALPKGQAESPRTGPRVADLVAGEPAPKFKPPAESANLAQKAFEEIYRSAEIEDSPCSVDELAKLMENPAVVNQPLSVKIIAVNLALSAKGVSHEVPIADAVRRDRALDAYQAMLDEHARATEQRNTLQLQQLTQEVEEFLKRKQAEMDALREGVSEAKRQSLDFSVRREAEEQRLAGLISPFLSGQPNPVTVGNQPVEAVKPNPAASAPAAPSGKPKA
jgi:hypothetical protein